LGNNTDGMSLNEGLAYEFYNGLGVGPDMEECLAQLGKSSSVQRLTKENEDMGIQLEKDELEEFLLNSHTLILSTIRKSGEPFMTPLWYVYMDGAIYFSTPSQSAKVDHLKRDPRVCCLIEEGERWVDLKAVVINCDAEFVDKDSDEAAKIQERTSIKYADFRPKMQNAPSATKAHYSDFTYVKLVPRAHEIRSWYNRKLRGIEELV